MSPVLAHPTATSLSEEVYARMPNDTDLTVFIERDIPGVNFAFIDGVARYHTPLDDLTHLDPASVQHQGQNALAVVRALAELEAGALAQPPTGQAVYADLLGLGLFSLPVNAVRVAAVAVLAALLLGVSVLRRRAAVASSGLLWGVGGFFFLIIAPALAGLLSTKTAMAFAGSAHPANANGLPLALTLGAGALAVLVFLGPRFAWRASFASLWCGIWSLWAVFGVVTALAVPGISYLFVTPAAVALAALLLGGPQGGIAPRARCALVPLVVAAVLWFPVLRGVVLAFDQPGGGAAGLMLGFLLTTTAPLFRDVAPASLRLPLRLAGLVWITALVAACNVEVYTSDAPRRMNFIYHLDADARTARWLTSARAGALPSAVAAATGFGDVPQLAFPWSSEHDLVYQAPARKESLAPPRFRVSSREKSRKIPLQEAAPRRSLRGRLVSPRGADALTLIVPRDAGLHAIRAEGQPLSTDPERASRRFPEYLAFFFHGVGPEGIQLELEFTGLEPVEARLVDTSAGLPDSGAALLDARPASFSPSPRKSSSRSRKPPTPTTTTTTAKTPRPNTRKAVQKVIQLMLWPPVLDRERAASRRS
jgi:hypothetical protein